MHSMAYQRFVAQLFYHIIISTGAAERVEVVCSVAVLPGKRALRKTSDINIAVSVVGAGAKHNPSWCWSPQHRTARAAPDTC